MYSAIKKDGKRLYELAREGKEIDRVARHVEIYSIELISVELPYFTMRVHCGKGTYIRSLCRDIGAQIGCGACMDRLCRTQVGRFTLSEALTLEKLQKLKDEDRLSEEVIPVDVMFEEYMPVHAGEEYFKLIKTEIRLTAGYAVVCILRSECTVMVYSMEYMSLMTGRRNIIL